ncbi:MAG: outer membrane beta-barrel protein [Alphaproteobacteria bacterium]|nr:outer membrane beta-barrel protein [Alphaproteobacteria bacterium]
MLKKIFLGSTFAAFAAGTGFAADLPAYPAPAMYDPVPVYNWTGFYVGGLIGGVSADFENNIPANPGPTGDAGGFTIGAQVGYNYQINSSWAIGAEADISFQDIEASSSAGSFEEDWMGTIRLRGGYTFSRYFVYATAGVAFTHRDASVSGAGSGDDTIAGFTGGVGVEGKLNDRWSAKLEYLYVDVPDDSFSAGTASVVGGSSNHVGRIGLNYHF